MKLVCHQVASEKKRIAQLQLKKEQEEEEKKRRRKGQLRKKMKQQKQMASCQHPSWMYSYALKKK